MQRLLFGGAEVVVEIFQSDPISLFPLHVQESPSLELYTIGQHNIVHLKVGLHPSTSFLPNITFAIILLQKLLSLKIFIFMFIQMLKRQDLKY